MLRFNGNKAAMMIHAPVKFTGVLKCRFYDYSGLVRPTDQQTIAIEKRVWSSSYEEGARHATQGHMGNHQDQSGGRGSEGQM